MKPENRKEEIIDMYVNQNKTTVQIAEIIGCSSSGIGRLLVRNGIKPHHKPNEIPIPKGLWPDILEKYQGGQTSIELGKEYGVCDATICKIVRELNGDVRAAKRRSHVKRHDFFETIDTKEKAYFLGWMISDGSVVQQQTRVGRNDVISIELKTTDRYIIERFAVALEASPEIVKDFQKRGHSHMRFASEKMAEDLKKYGVIPNKTMRQYLPEIREDLIPHMIRGYFDGNGSVSLTNGSAGIRCSFYGSKQICEDISNVLHDKLGIPLHKVSKSTCYHVHFSAKEDVSNFARYLYNDAEDLYLVRKKTKFDLALN